MYRAPLRATSEIVVCHTWTQIYTIDNAVYLGFTMEYVLHMTSLLCCTPPA